MKTKRALPRIDAPINYLSARALQKSEPPAYSLARNSYSYSHLQDVFVKGPAACLQHSVSAPRLRVHAVKKLHHGLDPKLVTFPTHTQIDERLIDPSLWPPKVTSKMVAVLYKACGIRIMRGAEITYSIKDAAKAIHWTLEGMSQMVNVEQMRALQVLLANVYVRDEVLRDALKAELRKCWDPQAR